MLYITGYINSCLINTFGIITNFFSSLNSCIIPEEEEVEVLPKYNTHFYNFSNLSNLEEVVVYEQPRYRRTRSDPNLKLNFRQNKSVANKDSEWDIL